MKTLQRFFGIGVAVALLGLNVVMADVKTESTSAAASLKFSLDIGDGSVNLPDISFDESGSEQAQATCATTPGGTARNLVLAQPPITVPNSERLTNAPRTALASLAPLAPPQDDDRNSRRRRYPPPDDPPPPPPPPPPTPEPATLLLVGLGIGAVAVVRQRGRMFRR